VKHFYSVRTAVLAANPPAAHYMATSCPGDPTWSLAVVLQWDSHDAQDAWEALASVAEHYLENMGQLAPAGVVTAVAPWGATAGMTLRQVFGVIRQNFSAWRH